MATKNSDAARSDEIDVEDVGQAKALAAAFRGIHHFFGGRVNEWEFVPPSEDNPEGGLIARGFSVNSGYNPRRIIDDIGGRDRRLEMFPFYFIANGTMEPADFVTSQDMTNFGVQWFKTPGDGEDSAKTPDYVKKGIAEYKSDNGLRTRRGPRRKIIRLDEELDESQLQGIDPEVLQNFLDMAQSVVRTNTANAAKTNTKAAKSTPEGAATSA